MKNKKKLFLPAMLIASCFAFILLGNLRVSTYQGVDYKVRRQSIPLYLKVLDFFSRNFHYAELTKEITRGSSTKEDKVFRIFEWTHAHIKRTPQELPVFDDHVWYTIIRGYGVSDQFCDIFTTLCNYSGLRAFFRVLAADGQQKRIALSFVEIDKRLVPFDPYRYVYFLDDKGRLLDLKTEDFSQAKKVLKQGVSQDFDYSPFAKEINNTVYKGLNRANIQSPLNRLFFQLKQVLNRGK